MKRRRILLILLGVVASITLAVLLWPGEPEPEYNGIPLSAWLENPPPREEFIQAIKHIGTNGLPILVRAVDYKLPRWRFWLCYKFAPKLPTALVNRGPLRPLLRDNALHRANSALVAFEILGPDASPALDDLRRIANNAGPSTFAGHAILILTLSKPGDFDAGRIRF